MLRGISNLIFLVSVGVSSLSWGWGALGHRATGFIAQAALTPQAQQAVRALLNGQSLADVATWADSIKTDPAYAHVSYYHYDKIPDGTPFLEYIRTLPPDQRAKGGVMLAVLSSERTLESRSESWGAKDIAMRLLVHFIGDMHQPLHTGRPDDKGGLKIAVKWGNQDTNLHSVWDSGLILTAHADLFAQQPQTADWSQIYAQYLIAQYGGKVTLPPATRDNPESWLNESLMIRPSAYDPSVVSDPAHYQQMNSQVVDFRVYVAGLRIADTINRIVAGFQPAPVQVVLMQKLEAMIGDLSAIITLGPRAVQPNQPIPTPPTAPEFWN